MKELLLDRYGMGLKVGDLREHVKLYLEAFERLDVYEHTLEVVNQVKVLHKQFDFDLNKGIISAYLHDVGRVVKDEEIVDFCASFGYVPLKGEILSPSILHQVASKIIATEIFGIQDREVLETVACHTTLKKHPSQVEMIVFLADKLSWREERFNQLKVDIHAGLNHSLEKGVFSYFEDMHAKHETLYYYHKNAQEAYGYFKGILGLNEDVKPKNEKE